MRVGETPFDRRKGSSDVGRVHRVVQRTRAAGLPETDATVKAILGSKQRAVTRKGHVVADHAAIVIDIAADAGTRVVGVGTCRAAGRQAEPDAPRIVHQHVALDNRIPTAAPHVDAVFGKPAVAPEPLDPVVADRPIARLVRVDTPRVAAAIDGPHPRATRVGQLDVRAGDFAAVRIVDLGGMGVDLDRLLARIDNVHVVDACVQRVPTVRRDHVNGMRARPAQRQVGDRHVGGRYRHDLGDDIVPVDDDGIAAPTGGSERHAGHVDPEGLSVQVIGAIREQDRIAGSGPVDRADQRRHCGHVHDVSRGRRQRGAKTGGLDRRHSHGGERLRHGCMGRRAEKECESREQQR